MEKKTQQEERPERVTGIVDLTETDPKSGEAFTDDQDLPEVKALYVLIREKIDSLSEPERAVFDELGRAVPHMGFDGLIGFSQSIAASQPQLDEELKKPEYGGKSIIDLIKEEFYIPYTRERAEKIQSGELVPLYWQALENARAAGAPPLHKTTYLEKLIFPTANLERVKYGYLWEGLEKASQDPGQYRLIFKRNYAPAGAAEETSIVTVTGDHLPISRYDKRVKDAVTSLWLHGKDTISDRDIYMNMGYKRKGNPPQKELKKINEAMERLGSSWVTIIPLGEAKAGYKFDCTKIEGYIIPWDRATLTERRSGRPVEVYHILRAPLFIKYEQKTNRQFANAPIETFIHGSMTPHNITLDDYLHEWIARIDDEGRKRLWTTIFSDLRIEKNRKDNKQKRTADKIVSLLQDYQNTGYIYKFVANKDGVEIFLPGAKKIPRKTGDLRKTP